MRYFSLDIKRDEHQELYNELTMLFRGDFAPQGRQGTFDDIVSGEENNILEVPYINWMNRSDEVRGRISELAGTDFPFVWPLVRDYFEHCHALISKDQFVVSPLYPIMGFFQVSPNVLAGSTCRPPWQTTVRLSGLRRGPNICS